MSRPLETAAQATSSVGEADPGATAPASPRPWRFALMAVPRDGAGWVGQARWAEDHGFAILQVPDTLNTASPFPALAAAAAVTTTLHVRPWVLAAPLRHPAAVVREVAAVQLLSGGRGELGIGIGRPGSEAEAGRLGMPWGSPAERRALVREVVEVVRAAVSPTPPIAITAAGPRMLAEAAEYADRIGLALGPTSTVADLVAVAGVARSARRVPLTLQLSGIGDRTVAWGGGGPRIDAAGAATVLPGDPGAAAALLEERRDRFGVDEVVVPGELAETFLPILARLG